MRFSWSRGAGWPPICLNELREMSCEKCEPKRRSGMRTWVTLGVVASVLAVLAIVGPEANRSSAASAPSTAASGLVAIEVNDEGFSPSSVSIAAGQEVELEFTRTTEETCATSVSFPELGIKKELPLNQPVRVPVPAAQDRTLAFQCGVGDHRSAVVIN